MSEGILWPALLPLAALALDLACGDPTWLWHPVRALGRLAAWFEPRLRRLAERTEPLLPNRELGLKLAGCLGVACLAGFAGLFAFCLASLPKFGPFLALYLAYAGLAQGQLLKECRQVAALLNESDLGRARASLAMLVSRETRSLGRAALSRALAETLSENFNDGFVAPFFFMIVGGALAPAPHWTGAAVAALWAYKAVSTLDSMWGYKTEYWRAFGWAAARTDDLLAYAPARLAALALLAAGGGLDATRALWRRVQTDASKTESPNAGWPMSAAAWVCGGRLGGPAVYFGLRKEKPWLGAEPQQSQAQSGQPHAHRETMPWESPGEWTKERLAACLALVRRAGLVAGACLWLLGLACRVLV